MREFLASGFEVRGYHPSISAAITAAAPGFDPSIVTPFEMEPPQSRGGQFRVDLVRRDPQPGHQWPLRWRMPASQPPRPASSASPDRPARPGPEPRKPLGRKSYGSIGHLPMSRMGPGDHAVPEGQAAILTVKTRDAKDRVIVHEKLDGSNTGVALLNGELLALGRAGYLARESPYPMHHRFADWVEANAARFRAVLRDGERLCGEWLAQAHGTLYDLRGREPWAVFDLMRDTTRAGADEFRTRLGDRFQTPHLLHDGGALSVADAMALHAVHRFPGDEVEGVVYRCERDGRVDFLAKYVRPDKVDGKYLKGDPIWLWPA